MKLKFYSIFLFAVILSLPFFSIAQLYDCSNLSVSYTTTDSRCAATGSISITVAGGSGNYNYKVTGPVNTPPTSSNIITGLPPGIYAINVEDIDSDCTKNMANIVIGGSYTDPGFGLIATDLTCNNGSDGTITVSGIAGGRFPFQFKVVAPSVSAVGTVNTTGVFTNLVHGDYYIEMRDSCGGIQTRNITVQNYDWSIQNSSVTSVDCDNSTIDITLIDNKGNTNIAPGPAFNGFTYGVVNSIGDTTWSLSKSFTYLSGKRRELNLVAKDRCGNVKTVTWNVPNKPRVSSTVGISNQSCSTFTAYIRYPHNLTNPQYCLLDITNTTVQCNTTGTFDNVPYGTYTITVRDICYDTTIVRTVTQSRLVPSLGSVTGGSFTCNNFTATVNGQSNVTSPQYCLYDASTNLIGCNTTGVFPGLAFGSYCIKMQNSVACYDTTIERCFNIQRRVPSMGASVTVSNRACSTFTASATGQTDLTNPQYCLYDNGNNLITCNSTGVFNNLVYGSYCITMTNDPLCYDTIITRCFSAAVNKPSVNNTVSISNKSCSGFRATIQGQANLTNPQYCVYNSLDVLVSCNTTGDFSDLPYGSYCVKIVNNAACYDTTIQRCITVAPNPVVISVSQHSLCELGKTEFHPEFVAGTAPYTMNAYDPSGNLLQSITQAAYNFTFQLPDLAAGLKYKFVGTDNCGVKDTVEADPFARVITKSFTLNKRCPGGTTPNGSSDLIITVTSNEGTVTPSIINKNGTVVLMNYTVSAGNTYTFSSLEPTVYIVRYNYQFTYSWGEVCNSSIYDTITVTPYVYPGLANSSAYQCDNNSFSVGGSVNGGVAPYSYEIIGSVPSAPSIATAPQVNPLFAINNGVQYELVRLRAIDACGNATLGDVSVLPMANLIVGVNGNCYYNNINLTVKDIPNALYTWYKKTSETDSVEVGNARTFSILNLLPSDTGTYVCKTVVNNGCLIRLNYKHVNGNCYSILENEKYELNAVKQPDAVELSWANAAGQQTSEFIVERQTKNNKTFSAIGTVRHAVSNQSAFYQFTDNEPEPGVLNYRLKIRAQNGTTTYSNVVSVTFSSEGKMEVYPNPVLTKTLISFHNATAGKYLLELVNMNGQPVFKKELFVQLNGTFTLLRNTNWAGGMYVLKLSNPDTGKTESKLIRFE